MADTSAFRISSRLRGTGIASRYRRLDQDASLATESPKNSATTTISRKPTDMNSANTVKFMPPLVPSSINPPASESALELPTVKAMARITGSRARKPIAN